ncbi:MAG TPA: ribosome-associated translation inhibitor RaiA [Firmicutes bacterium]|nr:ribosome-associated translation inhibitor RaiA [Bacillota bacterium]
MKIAVRGKNIDVTPALRDYASKRISKLDKYFDNAEAQVNLSVTKESHIVEVTVLVNGLIIRGEEETEDMYASIDLVIEKLEKQIEKYKTRLIKRTRNGNKTAAGQNEGEIAGEEEPRIVRTKRFDMKPMAVEEAIMQMNLVGHDFFVFVNAQTENVNVVYRRKDKNYGLIEPIF